MSSPSRIAFVTHGGGPLPLLGDPSQASLLDSWRALAADLGRPRAIVLVSAHWEAAQVSVTASAAPGLLYDYYGFAEPAYALRYPAPGEPQLARQLQARLAEQGIEAVLDEQRGFDHGMFVPLTVMYPDAAIPVVQLSLLASLDAEAHLALGRALRWLAAEDVLLLGSGSSFHNMQVLMGQADTAALAANRAFEDWLAQTCAEPGLSAAQRQQRLQHWQQAPAGRFNHPREEHLLPLHVCVGAAGAAPAKVYRAQMGAVAVSGFAFPDAAP